MIQNQMGMPQSVSVAGPAPVIAAQNDENLQPAAQGFDEALSTSFDVSTLEAATLEPMLTFVPGTAFEGELAVPLGQDSSVPDIEVVDPICAEQWLLSMLGQQAVQVQVRGEEPLMAGGDAKVSTLPLIPEMAFGAPLKVDELGGSSVEVATPVDPMADAPAAHVAEALSSMKGLLDLEVPGAPVQGGAVDARREADAGLLSTMKEGSSVQSALALQSDLPQGSQHSLGQTQATHVGRQLSLSGSEARWGEQMLSALRDNIQLQLNHRVQTATIRLDPPELGSLEILLRHESGHLNVQIVASQGDVARMMQSNGDRLRQELVGQNFLQVSVQVSADGQQGQGHQSRPQYFFEESPASGRDAQSESGIGALARGGNDVLITV